MKKEKRTLSRMADRKAKGEGWLGGEEEEEGRKSGRDEEIFGGGRWVKQNTTSSSSGSVESSSLIGLALCPSVMISIDIGQRQ
jgi:hypothetical protein